MIRLLEIASIPMASANRFDAETDIRLAIRLEQYVLRHLQLTVRAHVCENNLQLFGQVDSWHEKQQVQEAARAMAPEYRICNAVRVTGDRNFRREVPRPLVTEWAATRRR